MGSFRHLVMGLLISIGATLAHAQEDPYIGKTFAELMQLEDFRAAYLASLKRTPISGARWARADGGLPVSVYIPGPEKRNIVRTATCVPRTCFNNRIDVFFDPLERHAWIYTKIGARTGWSGGINPFLKTYFEPHLPKK
jgi:hypothetical protein